MAVCLLSECCCWLLCSQLVPSVAVCAGASGRTAELLMDVLLDLRCHPVQLCLACQALLSVLPQRINCVKKAMTSDGSVKVNLASVGLACGQQNDTVNTGLLVIAIKFQACLATLCMCLNIWLTVTQTAVM